MKKWEFSGNLDSENGIKNYDVFQETVNEVMQEFYNVFSVETMQKYPLLIDNAISGSGYTPIITPVLDRFIIIKLSIEDGLNRGMTIFQVAHELTHLVFYSLLGLNKEKASDEEESLCTAASLCLAAILVPNQLEHYINHVINLQYTGYKKGAAVAIKHNFSLLKMKNIIFEYCEKSIQHI